MPEPSPTPSNNLNRLLSAFAGVSPTPEVEDDDEHDVKGFTMHTGHGPCLCGHSRDNHEPDGVSCFCRDRGCFCVNYEPAAE